MAGEYLALIEFTPDPISDTLSQAFYRGETSGFSVAMPIEGLGEAAAVASLSHFIDRIGVSHPFACTGGTRALVSVLHVSTMCAMATVPMVRIRVLHIEYNW